MAVTFILGRAGAGKTHYCLTALLAALAQPEENDRRLILLVPEQASFQMERALATRAPHGGYWRAEVVSFSRLARRVFRQTGAEPTLLTPAARALALRAVVARGGSELRALRRAAGTNGFYAELDKLIEAFLREGVSADDLLSAIERVPQPAAARKMRELAQLYGDYVAWLGLGRIDAAARLAVLRERLAGLAWLRATSVWVDGFAGFTGQELLTLAELARVARDVAITLLLDPAAPVVRDPRRTPEALGLFQRTEVTYRRLLGLFTDAGVEVDPALVLPPAGLPRFADAPALAALEMGLATPVAAQEVGLADGGRHPATGVEPDRRSVSLYECATHRDELQAAARWIRTQIADAGGELRYRDFAVIARDLEPLADLVAEVFAEYELPYFLDRRRPLRAHPLSRLVEALFEAALTDFDVQPMVRLLRTRLLPFDRDAAERLENIVVGDQVRGLALWRQPTWSLERAGEAVEAFAQERARIVATLVPLMTLAAGTSGVTGATWARTLHDVLTNLGVAGRIEEWITTARAQRRWESAETHRLAWTALCDVLDDLHDILGDTPVTAADAAAVIGRALGELTLGLAPPTVDQVLVSSIERSRHPDIKHAWVLALNEGVFPARPGDDVLLSTAEREALTAAGLAGCAPHREDALGERLLAYIAFTRPSRSLVISYATLGEDGGALQPSPLLAEVTRALPWLAVVRPQRCDPPVNVADLARGYLSVRSDDRCQRDAARYERLCAEVRQAPALAGPLGWLLRGIDYWNRPEAIGNYRRPRGGTAEPAWDGSPSEVETYLQCPFKHFAKFGLRLDPARGPLPLRWDLGSIAHEILADTTRRAIAAPGGVHAATDERWQEWLAAAVADFRRRQPADQAARRPDLVFMGDVLVGFLRDVVAAHAARWRRGTFTPLHCEIEFSPSATEVGIRGVELPLAGGGRVHLHGRIDRVDCSEQRGEQLLLVYDYKSGAADPVGATFLTGQRLQLFIYLLALQQACGADRTARPAGVFLAPLYPDLRVLENRYAAEAEPAAQVMYMYRPRGLVAEEAARRLDHELGPVSSPVAQMKLKQDGAFYANCDARPGPQVEQRLELAQRTVVQAAEGITRGCIDVAPLSEKHTLACRVCDFAAVCRYDPAYNRARAAEAVLPKLAGPGADEGADE